MIQSGAEYKWPWWPELAVQGPTRLAGQEVVDNGFPEANYDEVRGAIMTESPESAARSWAWVVNIFSNSRGNGRRVQFGGWLGPRGRSSNHGSAIGMHF